MLVLLLDFKLIGVASLRNGSDYGGGLANTELLCFLLSQASYSLHNFITASLKQLTISYSTKAKKVWA